MFIYNKTIQETKDYSNRIVNRQISFGVEHYVLYHQRKTNVVMKNRKETERTTRAYDQQSITIPDVNNSMQHETKS